MLQAASRVACDVTWAAASGRKGRTYKMHVVRVCQARGLVRVDGIAQVAVDARPPEQHVAAVNVRLPRVGVVLPPERDGDLGQDL